MFIVRIADFLLKYSDVINFRKHQKVLLEEIRYGAMVQVTGNGMLT